MASFSSWFYNKARSEAASEFLTTGVTRAILGGTACYNSEECASGYACVNNKCTFLGPQKASEECGTGTTTCGTECGKSTPGLSCLAQDCCGTRCCRYGPGYVICNCGECPVSEKECSQFCTSFYQNNITSPLPAGCDGNYCDECESCNSDGFGGTKCKINNTGPCWCNETRVCELCSDDGYWYPDQACWPCRNLTKCGVLTGVRYCASYIPSDLKSVTIDGEQVLVDQPCELCEQPGELILCETISSEVNGAYDPNWTLPAAPPGYTNTKAGYFYNPVTNKTTYYIKKCQDWEPPAACFPRCRCNSDCEACSKCDPTTLTCVSNPSEPGCS